MSITLIVFLIAVSQISLTGCKSDRSDKPDTVRDTVYISENGEFDEEFINFFNPDSVLATVPDGFTYYKDYEKRNYGRYRSEFLYALGIMLPKPSYPHAALIARWVINRVGEDHAFRFGIDREPDKTQYAGNLYDGRKVFDYMADKFFRLIDDEDMGVAIAYWDGIIMNVAYASPRFITYREDTNCYWGGAHGLYGETYLTLDYATGHQLDINSIFRNGSIDSVMSELSKVASLDSAFVEANHHKPGDDISQVFRDEDDNYIMPRVALLESGVVFSFQPYEIAGFADGCFHFVVPYTETRSYLTEQVKALIP